MSDKFAAASKAIEDAVAVAKKNLEGALSAQKEQFEKATSQILKSYEDVAVAAKENVVAVVASSTIVAKGAEEAGKQVAAFTQSSAETAVANGKAALAVKTINELFELQTSFFKTSVENFIAESSKLQELTVKIANDAAAPISARVNATVEKLVKPVVA
ncbi:MAG TPA: TIGR01841 family phasin [Azospirillaceae bacterium]|nr:TIGR01841 family phasin [Azospirillaceae bacterium]HRQ80519.1 TIGR01841 family phasin [Azospirillaceae bacterium]